MGAGGGSLQEHGKLLWEAQLQIRGAAAQETRVQGLGFREVYSALHLLLPGFPLLHAYSYSCGTQVRDTGMMFHEP